ncbi:Armadillo-type fold [Naviculisporaceae sp. PSN 640]
MDESLEATGAEETAAPAFLNGLVSTLVDTISRATSPGPPSADDFDADNKKRYRPRTFSYFRLLPFEVEEDAYRDAALQGILRNLYISVMAEDFSPGALHWTRELQGWLNLKFEMTRELRARLTQLYYHLALAPGLDSVTADRFSKMVITLTRKKHYLKPGEDLTLDWRPLWKEVKGLVLPSEAASHQGTRRRAQKHLLKLTLHANSYFDPRERRAMLEEFLPYFSTSDMSNAYIVVGLLNAFIPTGPAPPTEAQSHPSDFVPTFFHLWSLMTRSKSFDVCFIDIFSRMARDYLSCTHVPFSEHGIFTRDQSDLIFTAILRLTEIPVGQANSPYSALDYSAGLAVYLDKDKKKYPVPYMIARWIGHSLSPLCLTAENSILSNLEGLMQSIDTFFHPSNQGNWTNFLAQLTFFLTDIFVSRWNREQSGELDIPQERRINAELKKRFVSSLREVTFMGLFAKSSKVVNYYNSTLQGLAFLEPDLMLPGALQRFYPSLSGVVEVHRTTSSLGGLQMIANIMSKQKGYRCHIPALLALALPGIDANDLNKTQYTLNFIQSVAYSIPFASLARRQGNGDPETSNWVAGDSSLARDWVASEMERMEREGQTVEINYREELSDEDEVKILRSSTAGIGEWVIAFLGKVFTLLENLPDSSHLRTGSPEDNVINTLPAALTPLFASLSPELFDMALDKLVAFVSSHVVHQARDAMAWICNALCKVHPAKSLKVFLPMLIVNIRNEIDDNGAASDRSSGTEVLPRDRALVWYVSILSMCVVHVGSEVLKYKKELFDIAQYMQAKCRGLPTIHISNYIHHLLLNLTHTYPLDNALYEPDLVERGLDADAWGHVTSPSELTIRWHRPSPAEIEFATEVFESEVKTASQKIVDLMGEKSHVTSSGKNKEWSDELSRSLTALRLIISGVSTLFDPNRASGETNGAAPDVDGDTLMEDEDDDPLAELADDDELKRQFRYPAGYPLSPDNDYYDRLHKIREDVGQLLSQTHQYLNTHQQDDVACFTALYATYRTWITDVGIERSAHPLERLVRLYKADISPFKISGLRKVYPRPLLIKRADAYHLQRVKYNAAYRKKSELDKQLLLDLAQSCTSVYTDVRRVAQNALDSSLKVLIGGRPLVIPVLLDAFRAALDNHDHDRIKGAMFTLVFSSLLKTLMRDWRFAPTLMRLYIEAAAVDKQSIQTLGSTAVYPLLDFGKAFERMIIYDKTLVDTIRPADDCSATISRRHEFIKERRQKVEQEKAILGLELTNKAKVSHWKIANRCSIFALNLCLRFDSIAPPEFIDLVANGAIDPHPGLRANFMSAFSAICTAIDMRAVYSHEYKNYLEENEVQDSKYEIDVPANRPGVTDKFLEQFEQYEPNDYFVDVDHPGWLVWGKKLPVTSANPKPFLAYDEVETAARQQIGKIITEPWLRKCFEYLKQEPRDTSADRFRMQNVVPLMQVFDLMHYGVTTANFDDLVKLTREVYGDGTDKHQHRATAEILGALLSGSTDDPREFRDKVWGFAAPFMLKVIHDDLTPDTLQYWMSCLHLTVDGKDPRRSRELIQALSAFRVDAQTNAAFRESAKIQLLEFIINDAGWHFRHERPILHDFLQNIDHPFKTVREAIGRVIATIYRTRYHESFPSVTALLEQNKAASSVGLRPYNTSDEFSATINEVFGRLEEWRHERTPGQQTPSKYTSGSKTVLVWLDGMLSSQECCQLVPFFAEPFINQFLHMMDVKEDPELMKLAYHVYRHLPNIPFRSGEDEAFIAALIRVGKTASSWHQRLRALVNMQVIYFRRLFLTQPEQRQMLFDAVGDMLSDPQLEVRDCAGSTLAGMIRCSPAAVRNPIIYQLKDRFEQQIKLNPAPKRKKLSGTDTPVDVQKRIVLRHAAVLGLGALVEAFPYATPLPTWVPEVLAFLASRTANDSGIVGKAAKSVLSEYKKIRQDSRLVDEKSFTTEQLQDLEGVFSSSYFA